MRIIELILLHSLLVLCPATAVQWSGACPAACLPDGQGVPGASIPQQPYKQVLGGIIQGDTARKQIALVFTGHEFADGGKVIRQTLKKEKAKGSFFLTGDFYRSYPTLVN